LTSFGKGFDKIVPVDITEEDVVPLIATAVELVEWLFPSAAGKCRLRGAVPACTCRSSGLRVNGRLKNAAKQLSNDRTSGGSQ
jgi:hypothetical protein